MLCWSTMRILFSKSINLSVCNSKAYDHINIAVFLEMLLGRREVRMEMQAWKWWTSSLGRAWEVTRMKASWGLPFTGGKGVESQESQEAEKSRSPGSGNFQGWGVDRAKYKCLPSQLELEVCIGWGGCAWDIGQNHMRKPMLRMIKCVWSMAEPWREPDSGLPSGIFYSVSFTSVRDWLLWYDLFAVPRYIILATCSHFS